MRLNRKGMTKILDKFTITTVLNTIITFIFAPFHGSQKMYHNISVHAVLL